ncbi:MAG: HlyD family secretion protein [Oscillospiraceae bacterium]
MGVFSKLWNHKTSPDAAKSARGRALRGMGWLLALMICLTLVSRAADGMTIARVQTETPRRTTLVHTVDVSGQLETVGNGIPVLPGASALISELLVEEGDTVEEGDLLFTFDTSELNSQIAGKQLDIQEKQAQLKVLEQNRTADADKATTETERLGEDYDATVEKFELRLQEAAETRRQAYLALQKYNDETRDRNDDEYGDYTENEYNSLRSAYRQAIASYEQIEAERDEALRGVERQIEDSVGEEKADSSEELLRLGIRRTQLELADLYSAVETEGKVYAPVGGIVTGLQIKAGGMSTGEAALTLTDGTTLRFTAEIGKEEKKHVQAGDPINLQLSGETKTIDGLTVSTLLPIPDKPDFYKLTVELPAEAGTPGQNASGQVKQKTQTYETCVSLSSLYQDSNKEYYVLVVMQQETTLGTEFYADKIPVTLLEKSAATAAVQGGLSADSKVILQSDKPLSEKDRVRTETTP